MIGVNKVANWKYECIVILALPLPDQQCDLSHCFQIATLLEFFTSLDLHGLSPSSCHLLLTKINTIINPLFNHDQYQPLKV